MCLAFLTVTLWWLQGKSAAAGWRCGPSLEGCLPGLPAGWHSAVAADLHFIWPAPACLLDPAGLHCKPSASRGPGQLVLVERQPKIWR